MSDTYHRRFHPQTITRGTVGFRQPSGQITGDTLFTYDVHGHTLGVTVTQDPSVGPAVWVPVDNIAWVTVADDGNDDS